MNREETGLKIRVSDPYVKDGRQYHGYKIGRVFDVTQTHGKAVPAPLTLRDNTPEMEAALSRGRPRRDRRCNVPRCFL